MFIRAVGSSYCLPSELRSMRSKVARASEGKERYIQTLDFYSGAPFQGVCFFSCLGMAASLHLCGVRFPYAGFKRSLLPCQLLSISSRHLEYAVSVASASGLCGKIKGDCRRRVLKISCESGAVDALEKDQTKNQSPDVNAEQLTCVMKFGGSSVASAERMREIADLILSFDEEKPVIVLSAMGKTTNKLLQVYIRLFCKFFGTVFSYYIVPGEGHGEIEYSCVSWRKGYQLWTVDELGVDRSTISGEDLPGTLVHRISCSLLSDAFLIHSALGIRLHQPHTFSGLLGAFDALNPSPPPTSSLAALLNTLLIVLGHGGKFSKLERMQMASSTASLVMVRIRPCGINLGILLELFIKILEIESAHLEELEQLLKGIAMMKELTLRTRDYLVSFGECMSTRIFAAHLNKLVLKPAKRLTNADILEATYPAVAKRLHGDWISDPAIPIVTGFLGKGWRSCAVTTLGRGGSDLTATTIGKALGLREIQVWKDVDGVLTCDPNIYPCGEPVPHLTFDEAAELAYFGAQVLHPQSMRPAREGDIPVRVKNSYNPKAPGTLITKTRDRVRFAVLTSIVLKRNVTMLDIVSTRMLGQFGFLAKVFSIFEDLGISVDVGATSEVSISLTLDPSKLWSRELIQQASELDHVVEELEKIAVVNLLQRRSIISLIGNVQRSSLILERIWPHHLAAFYVLRINGVNVQMISQGASKVNISLIVNDSEAEKSVRALHSTFFESALFELDLECGTENGSASPFPEGK
ncbi:hypothetical protein HHK36_007658 [Tetracentron sinense]|uniref:aspartate kinase n=1 Tax=Tetracentron sinense TaxID=13715 RepID=A0A834ZTX7_TETSI|nr:hypothetical protein HHK36_007658 [Tetracentron sinense]